MDSFNSNKIKNIIILVKLDFDISFPESKLFYVTSIRNGLEFNCRSIYIFEDTPVGTIFILQYLFTAGNPGCPVLLSFIEHCRSTSPKDNMLRITLQLATNTVTWYSSLPKCTSIQNLNSKG